MRGLGSRHNQHARRAAIQAMYDTGTKWTAGQAGEAMQQRVHQRAPRVSRSCVHHHPRRLVHDDDVIILIENVERNVLGLGRERGALQNFDFNFFASGHAMRGACRAIRDAHARFTNQFLNTRAAEIGKLRGEVDVEALPSVACARGECADLRRDVWLIGRRNRRGGLTALTTNFHGQARARRVSRPENNNSIKMSAAPTVSAESATLNAGQR
jgi:hypothetical protein